MKIKIFTLLLMCTSCLFAQTDSTNAAQSTLSLQVVGLTNNDGVLMIALCNSKENYEKKGSAFRGERLEIVDRKVSFVFENVPFGEYAIKVFHDKNGDGKLNSNFLGIPSEDYGFSNNADGTFGPASWQDAKFNFEQNGQMVSINLDK